MHVVENTERLKYAITTGIKWPITRPSPPSSGLECGGQEADGFNQVLYPESPPRRRGPRLDSRLRGNDGRYYLHAFTARLKPCPNTKLRPGPVTRRFGVRRLAAAFPGQGLPCPDTRYLKELRAQAGDFLHQNEPKVIDNKPHHKKRTQERTQFQCLNLT